MTIKLLVPLSRFHVSLKIQNKPILVHVTTYYNIGKQGIHEEFGKQFFTSNNMEDKDECKMIPQKWIFRNQDLTLWT
jgi:hypothetical protein